MTGVKSREFCSFAKVSWKKRKWWADKILNALSCTIGCIYGNSSGTATSTAHFDLNLNITGSAECCLALACSEELITLVDDMITGLNFQIMGFPKWHSVYVICFYCKSFKRCMHLLSTSFKKIDFRLAFLLQRNCIYSAIRNAIFSWWGNVILFLGSASRTLETAHCVWGQSSGT